MRVDDEYRTALDARTEVMGGLGFVRAEAQVAETSEIAPHHALARVTWTMTFERDGIEVASTFDISYVVRMVDDPAILLYISHEDEAAVMERDGVLPPDNGR